MQPLPNHDRLEGVAPAVGLHPLRAAPAPPGPRSGPTSVGTSRARRRVLRYAAAASIAVGGYIHLCLYRNGFRAIPKIGTGFLLQVVTSALVAGTLLIGRERILQVGRLVVRSSVAVQLSALGLSLGTLAAFGLTRTPAGLFNFQERGLQPAPQALIALVAELVATVLLVSTLVLDHLRPLPIEMDAPRRSGIGRAHTSRRLAVPEAVSSTGRLMARLARLTGRGGRKALVAGVLAIVIVIGTIAYAATTRSKPAAVGLDQIQHVVVVYMENWSFDSLYGKFPGANGIANATGVQVDRNGVPYAQLPQPPSAAKAEQSAGTTPPPDARFPAGLPNAPFDLAPYVPPTDDIGDPGSGFYQEQAQIDGGRMDRFVANGKGGALPMGYYDATNLPLGALAQQYTLDDSFFHAAFGSSMLNHFWLVSGATPQWPDAPASMRAVLDQSGHLVKDGVVTPDGYLVNTAYPADGPHPAKLAPGTQLVPPLTGATIGDRLSAKGVSWAWYAGGWSNALAGHPDPLFQFNHQPFDYYANYANGTPGQAAHLKDETDLVQAIRTDTLPAVSFYKPIGTDNEHPGYANLLDGEMHAASLIQSIMASKAWKSTAIVVAYDENGGFWDHVSPPAGDRWGPGTRVPAMVISPFAKRHFVDHTTYDTTSILSLIEHRFGVKPLGPRDAAAPDLQGAFTFK